MPIFLFDTCLLATVPTNLNLGMLSNRRSSRDSRCKKDLDFLVETSLIGIAGVKRVAFDVLTAFLSTAVGFVGSQ